MFTLRESGVGSERSGTGGTEEAALIGCWINGDDDDDDEDNDEDVCLLFCGFVVPHRVSGWVKLEGASHTLCVEEVCVCVCAEVKKELMVFLLDVLACRLVKHTFSIVR